MLAAPVTQLVMPLVRVGTVPPFEPPYDDESAARRGGGGAALEPAGREGRTVTRLRGGSAEVRARAGGTPMARGDQASAPDRRDNGGAARGAPPGLANRPDPSPSHTGDPAAREAIRRLVSATVEVLNGFRPASHLRPLIEPVAALTIIDELAKRTIAADARRTRGKAVDDRVRVRQIRICEPIAGVAEAAVVLGRGDARWAMALRWEYLRGAWLCTIAVVI